MFQAQRNNVVSNIKRRAATVAAAAAIFGGVLIASSISTASAATSSGVPVFASVDIQKILNAYKGKSSSEATFQKAVDQFTAEYKLQSANFMLSAADQATLGQLLSKTNPTPADQEQVKSLQSKSQADSTQLTALQQKGTLTDADKAELSQLTQEQQAGQAALQQIGETYKASLDTQNQALSAQIADEVRAAVSSIAQKQGITVVFDSSVAIYTSIDLTQAVITKLNAAAAP